MERDVTSFSGNEMARIRIALRYYGAVSKEKNAEEYLELAQKIPQGDVDMLKKEKDGN